MSWQPEVNFVNNYRAQLEHAFQQEGSRLRRTVTVGTQKAKSDFHDRLESLGTGSAAHTMTARHGDTPLDDITHGRRRITMVGFNHNLMFDNQDKLRMLVDPTSDYAKAQAMLFGRKVDKIIIDAASGTAYTGETGATSQSFSAANQIAVDFVESGAAVTSNLTIAKLRQAAYRLDVNEVVGKRYFIGSASQKQALLRSTEVTSSDFNTIKALVNGEINTFMGFEFVWTELLTENTSTNVRTCLAYVPQAIRLNFGEELKVRIGERADKNYSIQVYSEITAGATRMWEEGVVEIACDEDA